MTNYGVENIIIFDILSAKLSYDTVVRQDRRKKNVKQIRKETW